MTVRSPVRPPIRGVIRSIFGFDLIIEEIVMAGINYPSNVPQIVSPLNSVAAVTSCAVNTDYLIPFLCRADVSVDAVWWQRGNTSAGNVYVGLYDADGTLLTDCAVDADTTAGFHSVSTTPVALTAGSLYYLAMNQSVQVVVCDNGTGADGELTYWLLNGVPAYDIRMTTTTPSGLNIAAASFSKARTNAALPSTQTMNSWTLQDDRFLGGFVPV